MNDTRDTLQELLRKYFGHFGFRSGQRELIENILSGRDVLGIMPTGAGKSVCYQIPALMSDGCTIVISPLISLMKDQVNSLIQSGISAAYINSSLTLAQYTIALKRAREGAYKLIYVAPERLNAPAFVEFARSVKISMIAVDEAHCVSQWGQDFRPSYLEIKTFADSLGYRPTIAAFTATATKAVRNDIIEMLGLKSPFCITTGFDRKNLYFRVKQPHDKLAETVGLVKEAEDQSGIIYCATRKNVELVCETLERNGIACTRYHAGLSEEERRKNQDDFIYDRIKVMAATNAFGMGIDKSNVSFVIHFNMPKDLESYYQEAGRAGRDGSEAVCTLLFSPQDIRLNKFLIDNSNETAELSFEQAETLKRRSLRRLSVITNYCTTGTCLREFILRYFGESAPERCNKCSNCAAGFSEEDVTIESQKILSCIYHISQKHMSLGAQNVADILRGSQKKRIIDSGLDKLSTYGIMKDTSAPKIRAIVEELVRRGYIKRGEFQTLSLTNKARGILFDGEKISMVFRSSVLPRTETARSTPAEKSCGQEDELLFELLRQQRAKLAQLAGVPAYIIFSDSTLHDMCVKKPTTAEEFLEVNGVGRMKAEKYGERFISLIADHLAEK